jgi:hypothetical protein
VKLSHPEWDLKANSRPWRLVARSLGRALVGVEDQFAREIEPPIVKDTSTRAGSWFAPRTPSQSPGRGGQGLVLDDRAGVVAVKTVPKLPKNSVSYQGPGSSWPWRSGAPWWRCVGLVGQVGRLLVTLKMKMSPRAPVMKRSHGRGEVRLDERRVRTSRRCHVRVVSRRCRARVLARTRCGPVETDWNRRCSRRGCRGLCRGARRTCRGRRRPVAVRLLDLVAVDGVVQEEREVREEVEVVVLAVGVDPDRLVVGEPPAEVGVRVEALRVRAWLLSIAPKRR